MKNVQWNKIKPTDLQKESFWVKIKENDLVADVEVFKDLEELFAAKPAKVAIKQDDVPEDTGKKGKELRVLDAKTSQNISILLGSLKASHSDIKNWILEVDEEHLTTSSVEQFIKYLPSADQFKMLAELKGKPEGESLSDAEAFAVEISDLKKIDSRLQHIEFKLKFTELVQDIKPDVVAACAACEEVKKSAKFSKILEMILFYGNYMNAGGRNAMSIGFEMKDLLKLANTKTVDNRKTFMHFLATIVEDKFPEVLNFGDELQHAERASRVSGDAIVKNLKSMETSIKALETDLKSYRQQADNDMFAEKMKTFLKDSRDQHEVLTSMHKSMEKQYSDLGNYFAFKTKTFPLEEFFMTLKTFMEQFKVCLKENAALREAEEKAQRAKEAKEAKEREKEAAKMALESKTSNVAGVGGVGGGSGDGGNGEKGVVDELLSQLNSGAVFKQRERKRPKQKPGGNAAGNRGQLQRTRSRTNILANSANNTADFSSKDISLDSVLSSSPKGSKSDYNLSGVLLNADAPVSRQTSTPNPDAHPPGQQQQRRRRRENNNINNNNNGSDADDLLRKLQALE